MLLLLLVATCCSFYCLTECGTCCRSKLALLNKNMPFVWLPVSNSSCYCCCWFPPGRTDR
jgi:hypothetical protein